MLMSKQQQYILETLQKLGCVRKPQLEILLRARFANDRYSISSKMVDALLRQLRFCNIELQQDGDAICLPGREANLRLLEAVDVMLELSDGAPSDFSVTRDESVLLRFSLESNRITLFAILHTDAFSGAGVRSPPMLSEHVRVIVLLDSEENPPILQLPNKLFYAVKQEDGTHRFLAIHH